MFTKFNHLHKNIDNNSDPHRNFNCPSRKTRLKSSILLELLASITVSITISINNTGNIISIRIDGLCI